MKKFSKLMLVGLMIPALVGSHTANAEFNDFENEKHLGYIQQVPGKWQLFKLSVFGSAKNATFPGVPKRDVEKAIRVAVEKSLRARTDFGLKLSGCQLNDLNLSNVVFPNDTDFSRANLAKANLSEACLYEANFEKANLTGANLSEANLYNAKFKKANLSRANLKEAWLYHANFEEANLTGADLSKACLYHANFEGARFDKNTNFDGARNIAEANFDGAVGVEDCPSLQRELAKLKSQNTVSQEDGHEKI